MAATKITVNSNGSIRMEGDFEIRRSRRPRLRPCWTDDHWPLPLRPFRQQAVLRWLATRLAALRHCCRPRTASPQAQAVT